MCNYFDLLWADGLFYWTVPKNLGRSPEVDMNPQACWELVLSRAAGRISHYRIGFFGGFLLIFIEQTSLNPLEVIIIAGWVKKKKKRYSNSI